MYTVLVIPKVIECVSCFSPSGQLSNPFSAVPAACAATAEEEAMDTTASLPNPVLRSPAIATKNSKEKPQVFPGTQNRPPHLQMM